MQKGKVKIIQQILARQGSTSGLCSPPLLTEHSNLHYFTLSDCVPAGSLSVRERLMLIDSLHKVSAKATVITFTRVRLRHTQPVMP